MNAPKWQAPGVNSELTAAAGGADDGQTEPEAAGRGTPGELGIERVQGHGLIRCGEETLAETDYDVIITPGQLRGTGLTFEAGSPLDREPKEGPDISGRLLGPLYQAQDYVEGIYTLVFEDGREVDFRVIQPDTNEIIGVSVLRAATRARGATSER